MKFFLQRLLTITSGVTVAAFVVAFIVRHAKHGFALHLGNVAWSTFLIGVLVTVAVVIAKLVRLALDRRGTRPATR